MRNRHRGLTPRPCLAVLALLLCARGARGAEPLYVEFFDAKRVLIEGPVRVRAHRGSLEGLGFLHAWSRPIDPGTGLPAGDARLDSLEVTLPIGSATPALINAYTGRYGLSKLVLHFVRIDDGKEEEFYRVTITNPTIVARSMDLLDTSDPDNSAREPTETYQFVYERVAIEDPQLVRQLLYLPGDTNGDLTTDISDAIQLLGYLFLGAEMQCPLSGDINGDESLDISDGIALLTYLFAGSRPPPPPFPQCGAVPAGRAIPCGLSACEAGP